MLALRADNSHLGRHPPHEARDAAEQPAPADRQDDRADAGKLGDDLEAYRPLTREQRIAETRVDIARVSLCRMGLRPYHCGVIIRLAVIDRRAKLGDASLLHLRG